MGIGLVVIIVTLSCVLGLFSRQVLHSDVADPSLDTQASSESASAPADTHQPHPNAI